MEKRKPEAIRHGAFAVPESETAGPSPPPDFLLSLVALASFMLLSVTKAAHAAVSGDAWQEIRVRSG